MQSNLSKKMSTIRHDIEEAQTVARAFENVNEHMINSVGFYQIYMEIKRSQNPPSYIEIKNVLHTDTTAD